MPLMGFGQYALINEIGWVDSTEDKVWVEFYIFDIEEIDVSEINLYFKNKLIWFPDGLIVESEYFSIELDASLFENEHSQKSIFATGHDELELIYDGSLLHAAPMKCIPTGASLAWQGFTFVYTSQPSRNQANSIESIGVNPVELELSKPGGFYSQEIVVESNSALSNNQMVHWNMGDVPITKGSDVMLSLGIEVESGAEAAELAYIEASGYQLNPVGIIHTAEIRCFQVFDQGCPVSEISRNTYFLRDEDDTKYQLPVISITSEDKSFFGPKGIYGYGESGINFDLRGANWERPATIEYFDGGEQLLQQNIGVRIRGKSSRYSPQKSFKIYAREEYGKKKLDNVFFPQLGDEKLKRINIRTPHNDFINSLLTDHVAMKMAEEMNIDAPKSERCVLYLNGEFWGIYALQESIDEHFVETNFDIEDAEVLIVDSDKEWPFGYAEILNFALNKKDLQAEDMNYLRARIDLPSMMEYYALQIYLANWDWPQKNVKAWLGEEGEPLRYFFFDGDACFNKIEHKSLERFHPQLNTADHSALFSLLMTNQKFRSDFMSVLLNNMETKFSTPEVLDLITKAAEEIDPLINQQIARWGYPQSKIAWENSVQSMNLFAIYRKAELMKSIESLFGSLVPVYPNPVFKGQTIFFDSFGLFSGTFSFEVFDNSGRIVAQGQSSDDQIADLNLESGNYVILLNNGQVSRPARITID